MDVGPNIGSVFVKILLSNEIKSYIEHRQS